jgi:hypothetical protein
MSAISDDARFTAVTDDRLRGLAEEMAHYLDGLPMPDGPGAVSAFYTSLALSEVKSIVTELLARRTIPDAIQGEGWRAVPIEPTLGMFNALAQAFAESDTGRLAMAQWSLGRFREDYQAMLEAAPLPYHKGGKL